MAALAAALGLLGALALPMVAGAANLRNHIEAVRRDAAVVYMGVVATVDVSERQRDRRWFAASRVRVSFVARSPAGEAPATDTLEYPTWDDEHPPYAGDGQYRLDPGVFVIAFKDAWDGGRIAYLLRGTPAELLRDLEARRGRLAAMSADGLRLNEIDDQERRVQIELYQRLAAQLESAVADGSRSE